MALYCVLPDVLLPQGLQYLDMFDSELDFSGDLSDEELVEVPLTDPWYGLSMLVV